MLSSATSSQVQLLTPSHSAGELSILTMFFQTALQGDLGVFSKDAFHSGHQHREQVHLLGKVQLLGHNANMMRERLFESRQCSSSVLLIPKLVWYRPLLHGPALAPLLAPAGLGFRNP